MPSLTVSFVSQLRDDYKNYSTFVETGTLLGHTTRALAPHFRKIYTIEISERYYNMARSNCPYSNIEFINGDSSSVFKELLPTITDKTIFFLDGHWSSGDTGRGEKDCPLIEEITAINDLFLPSGIIIIDDARLFGMGPSTGCNEDWTQISQPALAEIIKGRTTSIYSMDSDAAKNDRLIIHIKEKPAPPGSIANQPWPIPA